MKKCFIYTIGLILMFTAVVSASSPKRFTDGVTNVSSGNSLGQYLNPSPVKCHSYFNDFDTYDTTEWTVTEDTSAATQALADGDGGILEIATNTAAVDDNGVVLQKIGESFLMATGKKAWFKTRFKINDATQSDIAIGLSITDTSPIASAPSDAIYFRKDDGDTNIDLVTILNSSATSLTGVGALSNSTYVDIGWYYDGISLLSAYVNDVAVGSVTLTSTNYCTDEVMTPTIAVQSGDTVSVKTLTVDYIFSGKER